MATKTKSVEESEVVTTSADEPIVVDEPGETPATEAPAANNEPEVPTNNEPEEPVAPAADNGETSIDLKELQSNRVITHVNLPEALTKENVVKYVTKTHEASEITKKL